jgi:hypothetical protein
MLDASMEVAAFTSASTFFGIVMSLMFIRMVFEQ